MAWHLRCHLLDLARTPFCPWITGGQFLLRWSPCGCRRWVCFFTLLCIWDVLLSASSFSQNGTLVGKAMRLASENTSIGQWVGTEASGRFGGHHGVCCLIVFVYSFVRCGDHEIAAGSSVRKLCLWSHRVHLSFPLLCDLDTTLMVSQHCEFWPSWNGNHNNNLVLMLS